MTTHFVGDTAVLTGRSLRHVLRSPDTIMTTAVMPIAFVDYLLRGVLSVSGDLWGALAWCLGVLLIAYVAATFVYRCKIN